MTPVLTDPVRGVQSQQTRRPYEQIGVGPLPTQAPRVQTNADAQVGGIQHQGGTEPREQHADQTRL